MPGIKPASLDPVPALTEAYYPLVVSAAACSGYSSLLVGGLRVTGTDR